MCWVTCISFKLYNLQSQEVDFLLPRFTGEKTVALSEVACPRSEH